MVHTLIGKTRFGEYGGFRNKIVWALLRPKVNNILSGLGWFMTYGIRTAPRVLLSDGGVNLSEDAESLRGCIGKVARFIRGGSHLNWQDAFWGAWNPQKQNCVGSVKVQSGQYLARSGLAGWVMTPRDRK